jgi:valyl-tRNA synthetase
LNRQPVEQSLRVHERCDTAVEYIVEQQWFVNVLDHKQELLDAGERVRWHPEHMGARYAAWVENLNWDWCISRQRYFGVTFPVWYCQACGETILAEPEQLPVDPLTQSPGRLCGLRWGCLLARVGCDGYLGNFVHVAADRVRLAG